MNYFTCFQTFFIKNATIVRFLGKNFEIILIGIFKKTVLI
ncbi:hypothetical protein CHCC20327_4347 [Bacillus licheniformis]|nr:hypothetical protein CHCC20327_4347 [Bacillus licheniformis]